MKVAIFWLGAIRGRMGRGTTKDTKYTKAPEVWFSCVSWITKSPARLCSGVRIRAGSMGWIWCALQSARGGHPSRMRGGGD